MPAQSVVATSSYSRFSFFARSAKNGSNAFFVSDGVGCSGPTPKRSFGLCAPSGNDGPSVTKVSTRQTSSVREANVIVGGLLRLSGELWALRRDHVTPAAGR